LQSLIDVWKLFKVNQAIAIIFACKGFRVASIHPVLYQPLREIIGDTCVQHGSLEVCYHINMVLVPVVDIHAKLVAEYCEMPPPSA